MKYFQVNRFFLKVLQSYAKSMQKFSKVCKISNSLHEPFAYFLCEFCYRRMYVNGKKQMFVKPVQKNYSKLREKC